MKILSLQAENVKKIKAVEIKPNGALVEIVGKNGQGKSSILDAIWWALAGTRHIQAVPIRDGENKARIRLDLGELIVERKFTASGTSLNVTTADGAKYTSPQTMLDDLIGALAFDPLEFVGMKPADQYEALRLALGLDFSEVEAEIDKTFEGRRTENKAAKEARSLAESVEIEGFVPEKPFDIDELTKSLSKAAEHNTDVARRKANRENAEIECERKMARVIELRAEAERLESEVRETRQQIDQAGRLPAPINVTELETQLCEARTSNARYEEKFKRDGWFGQAATHEARASELTEKLEKLRKSKADMIAAADMPVEGLGFGDGVVTLDGVPFDQASSAQQLRVSVALAMAGNPKLKVIRIKQGAFLDDDNLALIAEMANDRGYQVWVERVDSSGKVGIVIEDGEVVAVNEKAA